jgi:glycosyltransferase involved in cell wall biosynthesis
MKNNKFCAIIIPTIGRDTLDRAVLSVIDQDFPKSDFEVIVVNDSGSALPTRAWQSVSQVRMLNTNRRERSFARNSGAAVASGTYLAFLDDDDWLLPGAINSFRELANRHPNADWLYGGIHVVDEHGHCLAELNSGLEGNCFAQIVGGAWAPIQASLIKSKAFFQVGGFNPQIIVNEDEDLCRKIALHGKFANTPDNVACLFRGQTWNTSSKYLVAPEYIKYSRDQILAAPGAFNRLMRSSPDSYWSGRICRVYLSTVGWNLKNNKYTTAISRALFCSAAFIGAGLRVLSPHFWRGLTADHVPGTLHFVMQAYENSHPHQATCISKGDNG